MSVSTENQKELIEQVDRYLLQLRPYLHSEGCDAFVLGIDGTRLALRILLPSRGCASQAMLLVRALEYRIKEQFPDLTHVEVREVQRHTDT